MRGIFIDLRGPMAESLPMIDFSVFEANWPSETSMAKRGEEWDEWILCIMKAFQKVWNAATQSHHACEESEAKETRWGGGGVVNLASLYEVPKLKTAPCSKGESLKLRNCRKPACGNSQLYTRGGGGGVGEWTSARIPLDSALKLFGVSVIPVCKRLGNPPKSTALYGITIVA